MTEPTTEPCGNGQYATQARLAEAYRITIHQQREITQLRHTLERIKHLAYQRGQTEHVQVTATPETDHPAHEILGIVAEWCRKSNGLAAMDPGDLEYDLAAAGYPLPDDEPCTCTEPDTNPDPLHNITPNDHVAITIHLGINNNPPHEIATQKITADNINQAWREVATALRRTANHLEDTTP